MRIHRYIVLFYFLLAVTFLVIVRLVIINKAYLKEINDSKSLNRNSFSNYTRQSNRLKENNEWEELNEAFLIRIPSAFYYADSSLIRILFVSEKSLKTDFNCYLLLSQKIVKLDYKVYPLRVEKVYGVFILQSSYYSNESKMSLLFVDNDRKIRIKREIPLKIKKKSKDVKYTAICSDFYILDDSYYENFKWWIEINKFLGYKKIIFHNHSISDSIYGSLFNKYKEFLIIKSYEYMPHMKTNSFEYLQIRSHATVPNFEIHELLAYNECFMDHFNEYKRIAVMDADEIIIPKVECTPDKYSIQANLCNTTSGQICGEYNIDEYLERLRDKNYKQKGQFSYFFPFIGAIHNEYRLIIIKFMKKILNLKLLTNLVLSMQNFYLKIMKRIFINMIILIKKMILYLIECFY